MGDISVNAFSALVNCILIALRSVLVSLRFFLDQGSIDGKV